MIRGDASRLPLIHVEDAVSATLAALDRAPAGSTYEIVDDQAVTVLEQNVGDVGVDVDSWPSQRHRTILNMLGCGQAAMTSNSDGTRTLFLTDTNWRSESCQYQFYPQFFQAQVEGDFEAGADSAPYLVGLPEQELTNWIDLDANGRLLRTEVRAGTTRSGTLIEARVTDGPADLAALSATNGSVTGVFFGLETMRSAARVTPMLDGLLRDIAKGELRVVVDRTFPLSEAGAAHAYIESRAALGRVVLLP